MFDFRSGLDESSLIGDLDSWLDKILDLGLGWLVLMLCMDLVFGFVDLGIVYLLQGPCNQVDFEVPCCKCCLQHFISECFGPGTAVIGGSICTMNFVIAIYCIADIIQHRYLTLWCCLEISNTGHVLFRKATSI